MIATLEVYNKPMFAYRDECAVILLINAWELALKAVVSKAGQRVFYPKKRNQPYRTLSWSDAFARAREFAQGSLSLPVRQNLDLLNTFRDNAIHFYSARDFGVVVHALAQTAILNYRNLLLDVFNLDISKEMNWQVMPIGTRPPTDVVSYMSGASGAKTSRAVRQFLSELAKSLDEVRDADQDTSKLITIFDVKLESVKKVEQADAVVGVVSGKNGDGPLAIVRTQDPNTTHPLRQKDIIEQIGELDNQKFTQHTFQSIAWKFGLKDQQRYCWKSSRGELVRYSRDTIQFILNLPAAEVDSARVGYRKHLRSTRTSRT